MVGEIEHLRKRVDDRLRSFIEEVDSPVLLKKAMAHSLLSGGKRLRPLLVIGSARLFVENTEAALPAGCAVELVHTYSLIHDDLPAMDNDSLRRGVPTCHIIFGEAVAILAGDALLTEAFRLITSSYGSEPAKAALLVAELASAAGAGGMVGGQVLDVMKDRLLPPTVATDPACIAERRDLQRVHSMKTGALITASMTMGGIVGGATPDDLRILAACGAKTGLAFQVIDDIIDVTGTDKELGKNAGSDAQKGKETFVTLMGLEGAREFAASLERDALAQIERYGKRGELLATLIRLAVERRS